MAKPPRDNLHSRLVAILKVALPLIALALLSTLFLFSRKIDPEDAIPYATVDVEDRLRDATALATAGPDNTRVTIRSVAGFKGDDHRIEVKGEEVHATVDIYSRTSAIAGWSVVALLRNLVSPIVF